MLVHRFLEKSASRLPDKVALICGERKITFGQLNESAGRLAGGLIETGIRRGDRVVVFLDNSAEAVISIFGILKAGGVFVLLNPAMKSNKLHYILNDSGARAVITHATKSRIIGECVKDVPELDHIIWCRDTDAQKDIPFDKTGSNVKTSADWGELLESASAFDGRRFPTTIDVDLATIIYTSGSTGEPKGVVSAHCNVAAAAESITTYLENVEDDIILSALPLSFDYGLYQVLMASLFGGTVVLEKSFSYPYKIIERLLKERATGFPIVPTMVAILLQMKDLAANNFDFVRYISNTAAALPVSYIQRIRPIFPKARVYSMYGLTECKRVSYLPPADIDRKPESVGIAIPNEEVFIVDAEGREVGPGVVGELVVRGANVMQGYWKSPEETARVFRPGRYRGDVLLHTGDYFRKDEEGYLYFVSRKDDMIKTKGERVSPKEVENALCSIDGVVETAVVGVPDDIFGQAIKAYVVREKQSDVTEKSVLKYCSMNLEPFMVPKYVEFRESLPKSNSGKIDKKNLG